MHLFLSECGICSIFSLLEQRITRVSKLCDWWGRALLQAGTKFGPRTEIFVPPPSIFDTFFVRGDSYARYTAVNTLPPTYYTCCTTYYDTDNWSDKRKKLKLLVHSLYVDS